MPISMENFAAVLSLSNMALNTDIHQATVKDTLVLTDQPLNTAIHEMSAPPEKIPSNITF